MMSDSRPIGILRVSEEGLTRENVGQGVDIFFS